MENKKELFLRTIEDLEKRLSAVDPYEILGISALLRKLFLDELPLVDQINKEYRLKILFEVVPPRPLPPGVPEPTFLMTQDGLDPDTSPFANSKKQVSRDEFYKICVLTTDGKKYSIREIILFEANVMGAVHAGTPQTEGEAALFEIEKLFRVGGYAPSLRQLKAIGRVVLKALAPLREKARK